MSTQPLKILVTDHLEPFALERLRGVGEVTTVQRCDEARLLDVIGEFDAIVVRTYTRVTREVILRAQRLRVIGRAGVGVDNIDVEAAHERGIIVVHTPAAATEAVADLTIGLIIDLHRSITWSDGMVRAGKAAQARNATPVTDLCDSTIGIIGMGRIGRAVGSRCSQGLGMAVIYNDIIDPRPLPFAASRLELGELLARADVISLHVPLTDKTRNLISAETLTCIKPGAIIINTARGEVVDSFALAASLRDGRLAGAGLDVVDPEPLPAGHPLLTAANVVMTPHIGARTTAAQRRMSEVVDDVIAVLTGKPPQFALTD